MNDASTKAIAHRFFDVSRLWHVVERKQTFFGLQIFAIIIEFLAYFHVHPHFYSLNFASLVSFSFIRIDFFMFDFFFLVIFSVNSNI